MPIRVLMVHFTPPDVIGGVEHIMSQHIQLLRDRGFEIELITSRHGALNVPTCLLPEIDTASGEGQLIEAEMADGIVGEHFHATCRSIASKVRPLIDAADFVITHNAYTLHFSLPLTSVLWDVGAEQRPGKMVAWCHDLAWTNPLYIPSMHEGYPWSLLREPAPNTTYITVSRERRTQVLGLWGDRQEQVTVIPNGVDPYAVWRLSPTVREIAEHLQLLERDIVLLLPVRITRRKNIEAAIRTIRCLKDRGLNVRFLVSAPQAPHHPGLSDRYLDRLKALRAELDVEEEVVFLSDALGHNLDERSVAELYDVADVLFFPSSQEGFGLPILEAALTRVPIVLSDIPVFREIGGSAVSFFGLQDPPESVADHIVAALDNSASRLYRRVLREYRWDSIVDRHIIPLLRREAFRSDVTERLGEPALEEDAVG